MMEPILRLQRLGDVTHTVDERSTEPRTEPAADHASTDDGAGTDIGRDSATAAQSTPIATFEEFYSAHAGPIGQALELTLGDRELAEDALNEAMARALQRWKRVSRYANPQGWVYRVGMNWAMSWLRRRRRERDRPLTIRPDAQPQPQDQDLAHALAALSIEHRSVVICRFFFDWSVRQTAESLDVAEGTVKSRLARALENIRHELEGTP